MCLLRCEITIKYEYMLIIWQINTPDLYEIKTKLLCRLYCFNIKKILYLFRRLSCLNIRLRCIIIAKSIYYVSHKFWWDIIFICVLNNTFIDQWRLSNDIFRAFQGFVLLRLPCSEGFLLLWYCADCVC